jgi:hypothetical protein
VGEQSDEADDEADDRHDHKRRDDHPADPTGFAARCRGPVPHVCEARSTRPLLQARHRVLSTPFLDHGSAGVFRESEQQDAHDHQQAQEGNGWPVPSLRTEGLLPLLPFDRLDDPGDTPDHGYQPERNDDRSQDFHAQGIGSSSAPVQPPQERLEFLGG